MRLIFVRHAEPDYVHDSLTEKGFKEAEILAKRTKNWKPDEIYCLPLGRAQATMKPSLKNWKDKTPVTYDWLEEFPARVEDPETKEKRICWDFMPEYFCNQDDLHDKDKWYKSGCMLTGDVEKDFARTKNGIDKLLAEHGYINQGNGLFKIEKHSDDTLVFFCHFAITSTIVGHLTGIAVPALWQGFIMSPTGVTVLCSEERRAGSGAFRVQYWGDVSHLREYGEEISQSGYFAEIFQD